MQQSPLQYPAASLMLRISCSGILFNEIAIQVTLHLAFHRKCYGIYFVNIDFMISRLLKYSVKFENSCESMQYIQ